MYKKGKLQKGITLIALIITIIVMLILVGVTISMAVNGGLFNYAGTAVEETKNAINAEEQLADGGIKVGGNTYSSIDEYLVESGNKVQTEQPEQEIVTIYVRGEAFVFPKGLTFGEAINQGLVDTTRWSISDGIDYVELDGQKVDFEGSDGGERDVYSTDEPDPDCIYY